MRKLLASLILNLGRLYRRYSPTVRGKQYFPNLAIQLSQRLQTKEAFSIMRTREVQSDSYPINLTYNAMSVVGAVLETKCLWEPDYIARMTTQLRNASGPDNKKTTMLDIGSNYGIYSITAASHIPNCHAYAFECNPSILGTLRSNVALNSTAIDSSGSSVTVVDKAVSDRCGSSQFLERTDDGHGTLQVHESGPPSSTRGVIDVPTIDGKWIEQNLDFEIIDFCKIDVEGAELSVIKGLAPLLREKRIKRIQIEVIAKTSDVLDQLLDYGYTILDGDRTTLHQQGLEDFYLEAEE